MMYSVLVVWLFGTSGAFASFSKDMPELPGTSQFGMGYDAVTGSLPNSAERIVQFTFNKAATFTNPENSSLTYKVADQITVVPDTGIETSIVSKVVYSAQEYSDVMKAGIDFGATIGKGANAFSRNFDLQAVHSALSQRGQYAAFTQTHIIAYIYHASLPASTTLTATDTFLSAVAALPATYNPDNDTAYKQFISTYGTHYTKAGYLGGQGILRVAVNSDYAQQQSSSTISAQATLQSQYLQRGATGQQADQSFIKSGNYASSISSNLVGGDPAYAYDMANWPKWIESFFDFPAIIHDEGFQIVLGNWTEFIKNETIASNLNMAIEKYFSDNPYPDGPQCQASLLCPGGQAQECCGLGDTCCQDGCYDNWDDSCCNPGSCGQGIDCCGSGCCNPAESTCCSGSCYDHAGDNCCSFGGACDGGDTCCDSSCDGTAYCCADGHDCLCLFGVSGCNPFESLSLPSNIGTKQELSNYLNGTGFTEDQFVKNANSLATKQKEEKFFKQMKPQFPFNSKGATWI